MEAQTANILLLDDDPEVLRLLRSILEPHGYIVSQSSNVDQSLSAVRQSPPDLVLLAVTLATSGRYGICEELKTDQRTASVPVILVMEQNTAVDKASAFAEGVVDYIAKPFEREEVVARVTTHITLKRAQQQLVAQNRQLQAEIAKRKRAEEALQLSEERYRDLVENQPELICRFRLDTTLTFVNDAFCVYVGKAHDTLIGRHFLALIPEEDHPEILEYLAALSSDTPIMSSEYRVVHADGQPRWWAWTGRVICDKQGQIVEVQSTGRDVTERKQAEDERRASQARYRALVHHFPNGAVFLFDRDMRFLIADGSSLRAAGFSAEQLEGKMLAEALPGELVARLEPYYRAILGGTAPIHAEREYGGRIYSFEGVPLRDEHDLIVAGMLITQDVTEQRRYTEAILGMNQELEERVAERTAALTTSLQALEESRRFSEQVAMASPALLVLFDLPSWTIVYANRDPATVLGYPSGHGFPLSSRALCEIIHPDDLPHLSQMAAWNTLADQHVVEHELRIRHISGEWCCFMLRGSVFARASDGSVRQLLITALDVTAHHKIEEEIRAYHSRLVQAQDTERAHIARELHDHVGQILTVLNLTLAAIPDADPATIPDRIHDAQTQVRELTAQVRQLSLNLRPIMLDDLGLLSALSWHAQRFSEQTGLQVDVQHGELVQFPSPEVAMTAYRVCQEALTNVARHAETNQAILQIWTAGQTLYVQVTDGGRGFDVEAILAQPISTGLFGMQERVRLVGGMLSIESSPGGGTQIMAELPLRAAEQA